LHADAQRVSAGSTLGTQQEVKMKKKGETRNEQKPQPEKSTNGRFLSVPEAADEIGTSQRHVWREIKNDKLKVHRFGGCTRISRGDLDVYVRSSRG
jgi:excisionase family DNA binding protein